MSDPARTDTAARARAVVAVLVPPLLGLLALLAWSRLGIASPTALIAPMVPLAVATYLLAHLVRAVRFSVVASRLVPLRTRTLTLLHFNAAPLSLALPFKLGELYRLQQLCSLSGNVVRPVLVILIERALDAAILLALVAVLFSWKGLPLSAQLASLALAAALLAALVTVTIVGPALAAFQHYVVMTHFSRRVLRALPVVDFVRRSVEAAAEGLRGHLALLLCLSGLIWLLEAATFAILAPTLFQESTAFALSALSFAVNPVSTLAGTGAEAALRYATLAAISLAVVWPFATRLYVLHILHPRLWPLRPIASDGDPAPLSVFERSRMLKLYVPRTSL